MDAGHFLFIITKSCKVRKVRFVSHLTGGSRKSERGGSPQHTVSELAGEHSGLEPAPSHHAVIPTYHGAQGQGGNIGIGSVTCKVASLLRS